jgi:DNA-3-methyladenine glycosylase II
MRPELFLSDIDQNLKPIIAQVKPNKFVSTNNVFHDLMSCIIEQQIHYRSTKNIFKNLLKRSEIETLNLENFEEFDKKALQFIKISMNKTETISRIVHFFENNEVDWLQLSDDEIRNQMSSIKGIGTCTTDMISLYTLGRKNIFPVDDFRLKQVMIQVYGLHDTLKLKAQMYAVAKSWGNEKSLAVLYLLAYYEDKRGR